MHVALASCQWSRIKPGWVVGVLFSRSRPGLSLDFDYAHGPMLRRLGFEPLVALWRSLRPRNDFADQPPGL